MILILGFTLIILFAYFVYLRNAKLAKDLTKILTNNTYQKTAPSTRIDYSKYYQKFDTNYDVSLGYEWFKICINYIEYPNFNSLSCRLRIVRGKLGLTQKYVANEIGISPSTLSSYENSNYVSQSALMKLATLYKLPSSFLEKAYVNDLNEQIELCSKFGEDEYIDSLCVSVRAAYRFFYKTLTKKEQEICKYINQFFELNESTDKIYVPYESKQFNDFNYVSNKSELAEWGKWNHNHYLPNQLWKRKDSFITTVLFRDKSNKVYFFLSSKRFIFKTTLNDCSCFNFMEEKNPCKHMYRLFYELENSSTIENGSFAPDNINKLCIDLLLTLPETAVYKFISICQTIDHIGSYHSGKTKDIEILLEASLINLNKEKDYLQLLNQRYTKKEIIEDLIAHEICGYRESWPKPKLIQWLVAEHLTYLKRRFKAIYRFEISEQYLN